MAQILLKGEKQCLTVFCLPVSTLERKITLSLLTLDIYRSIFLFAIPLESISLTSCCCLLSVLWVLLND